MNLQRTFRKHPAAATAVQLMAGILAIAMMVCVACSERATGGETIAIVGAVALADRIGKERRDIAALVDKKRGLLEKAGQLEEEEAKLSEKADRTDDENKRLQEVAAEVRELYKQARSMNSEIEQAQARLQELEDRQRERDQHNQQEVRLGLSSTSGGQQTSPAGGAMNDPIGQIFGGSAGQGGGQSRGSNITVAPPTNEQIDKDIADIIRAGAACGNQGFLMVAYARQVLRNDRLAATLEQTMTAANNGAVIPPNYVPRMIEMLTPMTVIRRSGPQLMELNNGNTRIPKKNARATAAYYGESANIAKSTPGTTSVTLAAKKLAAIVVSTGELLRRSDPGADAMIRDDLLEAVALKEDSTFLRNTDTTNKPKGLLKYATDGSTVITANATVNAANVEADISALVLTLEGADVPMINPYFFMSPRSKHYLARLRDANGNKVYPELSSDNRIGDYPVLPTSQIPNNLGADTEDSEVYFADMAQFVLADAPTFILEANPAAAYYDGSAVQAAFSRDEVPVRIIVEHDFVARHSEAVAVLDEVKWGA